MFGNLEESVKVRWSVRQFYGVWGYTACLGWICIADEDCSRWKTGQGEHGKSGLDA